MEIILPHKFQPRQYQLNLLEAVDNGIKKAFIYWHRRSGKDFTLWNIIIKEAFKRVGVHYYYLPTFTQARRIIWDGIDNDGMKFLDHIPEQLIKNRNGQEMKIELINGSIIQLIGTDRYDAVRGTNPITNIFSEYAYQNPQAYEIIKPIAMANNGLMIFNTTPNGKNHSSSLREVAENSPDWFYQKLTINDTGLLSSSDMDSLLKEGMSKEMIQQEYYCSEEAGVIGSIYGDLMESVRKENRVCQNIYDPLLPVYTAGDIGFSDDTAITFYQIFGKEIRIIDFYSSFGELVAHYIDVLKSKPYKYAKHFFPWDARIKTLGSQGKSTVDIAKEYGLDNIEFVSNLTLLDGINQVRQHFSRIWFDQEKVKPLIDALINYKYKYDDVRKRHSKDPEHDWSSHPADSLRYAILSIPKELKQKNNYEEEAKKFIYSNTNKAYNNSSLGIKASEYQDYERNLKESLLTTTKDAY
jgi:hypothetical protein